MEEQPIDHIVWFTHAKGRWHRPTPIGLHPHPSDWDIEHLDFDDQVDFIRERRATIAGIEEPLAAAGEHWHANIRYVDIEDPSLAFIFSTEIRDIGPAVFAGIAHDVEPPYASVTLVIPHHRLVTARSIEFTKLQTGMSGDHARNLRAKICSELVRHKTSSLAFTLRDEGPAKQGQVTHGAAQWDFELSLIRAVIRWTWARDHAASGLNEQTQ